MCYQVKVRGGGYSWGWWVRVRGCLSWYRWIRWKLFWVSRKIFQDDNIRESCWRGSGIVLDPKNTPNSHLISILHNSSDLHSCFCNILLYRLNNVMIASLSLSNYLSHLLSSQILLHRSLSHTYLPLEHILSHMGHTSHQLFKNFLRSQHRANNQSRLDWWECT